MPEPIYIIASLGLSALGAQSRARSEQRQLDLVAKQNKQNAEMAMIQAEQNHNTMMSSLRAYEGTLKFANAVNKVGTDRSMNAFLKDAETKTANEIQSLRAQTLFSVGRMGLSTQQQALQAQSATQAAYLNTAMMIPTAMYQYKQLTPPTEVDSSSGTDINAFDDPETFA
jgi:hypothetical protein